MKSNYKRLGDYIQRCDEFNDGMQVEELLGISNNKYFQKSHTNTIGIDLSAYRIVRNNQFAFNRATTRNGDKISIALRDGNDCIVSPSYRVFKSKDETVLNSKYLMMWFRRSEFDRYARFKSHGSAHEFFDWEEMCEVELPVPHIDIQREIVKEYNIIVNRIKLNEKLCRKIEETVQTIYNYWFVDFEFPDENGKPFKSSGGEMEFNAVIEKKIPKGWEVDPFTKVVKLSGGGTPSTDNAEYWNGEIHFYTPGDLTSSYFSIDTAKKISELGLQKCSSKLYPPYTTFVTARGASVGGIGMAGVSMAMNQTCYAINGNGINDYFAHQLSIDTIFKLKNEAIGATFEALVTKNFDSQKVINPKKELINQYGELAMKMYAYMLNVTFHNKSLLELKGLLLSKLATLEN